MDDPQNASIALDTLYQLLLDAYGQQTSSESRQHALLQLEQLCDIPQHFPNLIAALKSAPNTQVAFSCLIAIGHFIDKMCVRAARDLMLRCRHDKGYNKLPPEHKSNIQTELIALASIFSQSEEDYDPSHIIAPTLCHLLAKAYLLDASTWPSFFASLHQTLSQSPKTALAIDLYLRCLRDLNLDLSDRRLNRDAAAKAQVAKAKSVMRSQNIIEVFVQQLIDIMLTFSPSDPHLTNSAILTLSDYVSWIDLKLVASPAVLGPLFQVLINMPSYATSILGLFYAILSRGFTDLETIEDKVSLFQALHVEDILKMDPGTAPSLDIQLANIATVCGTSMMQSLGDLSTQDRRDANPSQELGRGIPRLCIIYLIRGMIHCSQSGAPMPSSLIELVRAAFKWIKRFAKVTPKKANINEDLLNNATQRVLPCSLAEFFQQITTFLDVQLLATESDFEELIDPGAMLSGRRRNLATALVAESYPLAPESMLQWLSARISGSVDNSYGTNKGSFSAETCEWALLVVNILADAIWPSQAAAFSTKLISALIAAQMPIEAALGSSANALSIRTQVSPVHLQHALASHYFAAIARLVKHSNVKSNPLLIPLISPWITSPLGLLHPDSGHRRAHATALLRVVRAIPPDRIPEQLLQHVGQIWQSHPEFRVELAIVFGSLIAGSRPQSEARFNDILEDIHEALLRSKMVDEVTRLLEMAFNLIKGVARVILQKKRSSNVIATNQAKSSSGSLFWPSSMQRFLVFLLERLSQSEGTLASFSDLNAAYWSCLSALTVLAPEDHLVNMLIPAMPALWGLASANPTSLEHWIVWITNNTTKLQKFLRHSLREVVGIVTDYWIAAGPIIGQNRSWDRVQDEDVRSTMMLSCSILNLLHAMISVSNGSIFVAADHDLWQLVLMILGQGIEIEHMPILRAVIQTCTTITNTFLQSPGGRSPAKKSALPKQTLIALPQESLKYFTQVILASHATRRIAMAANAKSRDLENDLYILEITMMGSQAASITNESLKQYFQSTGATSTQIETYLKRRQSLISAKQIRGLREQTMGAVSSQ